MTGVLPCEVFLLSDFCRLCSVSVRLGECVRSVSACPQLRLSWIFINFTLLRIANVIKNHFVDR